MQREAVGEAVANAHMNLGAFANADERTGNLQRSAINSKCLHGDAGIGIAIWMPHPETGLEANRHDAAGKRARSGAVVVDGDPFGRCGRRSSRRRLTAEQA